MWTETTVTADPSWTTMPAVAQAARGGDYSTVLRLARIAAGLTLEEAGVKAGYSASTLSRWETRHRRNWDVKDLRHLATVYRIPSELLGLAPSPTTATGSNLSPEQDEGGDDMRRRDVIASAALAAGLAPLLPGTATASAMTHTIEDVLFGRLTAAPIPDAQLAAQIAAARADYRATRYSQLARRLPNLLAQATAGRATAPTDHQALAAGRVAQAYSVATQFLVKLHDNGMAWATADRAVQAANASADPLVLAEANRLAATVLRRTDHRDGAQRLVLSAAERLQASTGLPDATHTAMYGQLLAVAAYTAAIRDDRDTAWALLDEADETAGRTTADADRFNRMELAVYRISVARVLGDYGAAVSYARQVDPTRIVAPERRARYWEDTALALHGRGRPSAAFDALQAAERDVPEEVRYRPWAQQLTRDLLTGPAGNGLPGVRAFAARVGAA